MGYQFSLLWYHTAVGYQFPPLWYHTLNLKSPWIRLKSNLMIQGFNPCIKRKSHRKLVWYFLNHFNQLVGWCLLLNHHSFRSLHSLHLWWFSRTHLPTRWYQWFRKYHTRLSVGFPIIYCLLTKLDTIYIYIVSGHLKYFCNCVFGHNLPDIDMCCRNFFNEKGIYYLISVLMTRDT